MKIIIFSGAGISAESGISTFRDTGGIWENNSIYDVATKEAFDKNPELVLDFYNQRRRAIEKVKPNKAHHAIKKLEQIGDVLVITQNIDDLHERAGSASVQHLHGCITQAKSSKVNDHVVDIGYNDIKMGDLATDDSQLRPHVVWFGEEVPELPKAIESVRLADLMITVGTSLNVYPAASLIHETSKKCKHFVVDPKANELAIPDSFTVINEGAESGLTRLVHHLCQA